MPGAGSRASLAEGIEGRLIYLDADREAVAAAQRDPRRFDVLYRRYLAQIYSYAFYELGDQSEAEDVTERTFLQALSALPRFEERGAGTGLHGASTFRVWLLQIARNAVANQRRHARRHPTAPLDAASGSAGPPDPEGLVLARAEARDAWAAVRRLSPDRRRAIVLRFVHEMSTAEIAGVLGRSEGAVRVLIHRALRSLAHDLGQVRPGDRS